ncbi:MAG: hypothetical protein QM610_14625 [Chitinophagaceae bacterium]
MERRHNTTPPALSQCGNHYIKIKASKRTMWYVFFDKSRNRYLINFITNNHAPESAYINKL